MFLISNWRAANEKVAGLVDRRQPVKTSRVAHEFLDK